MTSRKPQALVPAKLIWDRTWPAWPAIVSSLNVCLLHMAGREGDSGRSVITLILSPCTSYFRCVVGGNCQRP